MHAIRAAHDSRHGSAVRRRAWQAATAKPRARDRAGGTGADAGGVAAGAAVADRRRRPAARDRRPPARGRPTTGRTPGESAARAGPAARARPRCPRRWNGNQRLGAVEREVDRVRDRARRRAPRAQPPRPRAGCIGRAGSARRRPPRGWRPRSRSKKRRSPRADDDRARARPAAAPASVSVETGAHAASNADAASGTTTLSPHPSSARSSAVRVATSPIDFVPRLYFSWNGYGVENPSDGGKLAVLTAASTQAPVGVPANFPVTVAVRRPCRSCRSRR